MPRLEKQTGQSVSGEKPTMRQCRQDIEDACRAARFEPGFGAYFCDEVCAPYAQKWEQPHLVSVMGGKSTRWEEPYRARIMQCLSIYIMLTESERSMLHAGIEDGVKWKGEPIAQFIDIVNEYGIMKQMGLDAYRARYEKLKAGVRL